MRQSFDAIDHLLALDLGRRGIASFFVPGAATAAARALHAATHVLIATGFTVAADTPETDGPPGTAVLGRALRRIGAHVRYVTDAVNVPVVGAALKALDEPCDVVVYPRGDDAAARILSAEQPTHLVAIERPGRTADGHYRNLRGVSIDEWNAPVDELFVHSSSHGTTKPVTIGVGDGGNEIGMGNVHRQLLREGDVMARIASVVRVDHLVVAATSNWGAYGIVAALESITGRELLHTPDDERRIVDECVAAGASDGVTRRRESTVDGLPLEVHGAVITLLRATRGRHRGVPAE